MAKVNLSAQVEETLRNRILNLEYPHNYILVEETLCGEFGVSRSPVREALRMLEASGLIHKMANRSYVVKQITKNDVQELYEIRLALEKHVVERLCLMGDNDELVRLMMHWQNLNLDQEPDLAAADRNFHEKLAEIYGNKKILNELVQINQQLRVFRMVDFTQPNRTVTTKRQHLDLLKAIHDKDVSQALKYLEINVNEGLDNAIRTLQQAILKVYER